MWTIGVYPVMSMLVPKSWRIACSGMEQSHNIIMRTPAHAGMVLVPRYYHTRIIPNSGRAQPRILPVPAWFLIC